MSKERLDVLLVNKGLATSREKAKAIIMSGNVYVDGKFIPQSNSEESIEEQDSISNIRIDNTALLEILANQEERLQSLEDK